MGPIKEVSVIFNPGSAWSNPITNGVCQYLIDNGYEDAILINNDIISLFLARVGNRVFVHVDGEFLVLEQPHEMGRAKARPKDNFELWIDLNHPESLPTLLNWLSQINSFGESVKR